jgi:stage III sporulation protein AG
MKNENEGGVWHKYVEKRKTNRSLLLVGSIIVLVTIFFFLSTATKDGQTNRTTEQQLAALLSEIHSVGQVQVYFHYEQAVEKTQFLAVAQQQQLVGVIIVAEGAHQANVKRLLKETVGNVLQIPTHRIQIVPMQMKEEEK